MGRARGPVEARARPRLRARERGRGAAEERGPRGRTARRDGDAPGRDDALDPRRRRGEAPVRQGEVAAEEPRHRIAGHIHIEASGDVAVVRIDRPPANALDLDLLAEGDAVREQLANEEPGAVVITGRERFFSAGMDLKAVPELSPAEQRQTVDGINRLFSGWYAFPRPVVAAVNGHAIAGGLILALCADHRVCADGDGKLGLTELRAGIPYPAAAIAVVRAELTAPAARRLVLGAALVGPEEALELGVVDELRAPEEVLPRALE